MNKTRAMVSDTEPATTIEDRASQRRKSLASGRALASRGFCHFAVVALAPAVLSAAIQVLIRAVECASDCPGSE
jgi:hypothetical protein